MNTIDNILKRELGLEYLNNHKDYKIVCFGASIAFNMVLDSLKNMQITPDFVCDNDKDKHGSYKNKYKIYSPKEVFSKDFDFLVIISSMYSPQIKEQLKEYKNIIFCEAYIYFLPLKIYKTKISSKTDKLKIYKDLDFYTKISVMKHHVGDDIFKECHYLNYLSYCNQIIAEDREDSRLYLCASQYNFNELNFKKILEYFIFRRYERELKEPIVIDSLDEFSKGDFERVSKETIDTLSDEKFALVKATQGLKKRKAHALVWHLYHIDMFEEINSEMQDRVEIFDIYISINHECTIDDIKRVLSIYPSANIFMFENRGRDVLPFLKIFQIIENFGYDSLCKIHTKRSIHRDDGLNWGKVLRTRLFDNKDEILNSFKDDMSIGAYVAEGSLGGFRSIGLNKSNIEYACKLLNIAYADGFSFAIGTMFWCKPKAIYQLASRKLSSKYFVIENGDIDGTFAHAIERLIGLLIQHNGYRFLEI